MLLCAREEGEKKVKGRGKKEGKERKRCSFTDKYVDRKLTQTMGV